MLYTEGLFEEYLFSFFVEDTVGCTVSDGTGLFVEDDVGSLAIFGLLDGAGNAIDGTGRMG